MSFEISVSIFEEREVTEEIIPDSILFAEIIFFSCSGEIFFEEKIFFNSSFSNIPAFIRVFPKSIQRKFFFISLQRNEIKVTFCKNKTAPKFGAVLRKNISGNYYISHHKPGASKVEFCGQLGL